MQGGPPTVEMLRPVGINVPSDERVFQVLDLCLQIGEALMSTGEVAADISVTMSRVAAAFGLTTVEIDITFTSITICCRRGRKVAPVTAMRLVRNRTMDLTRLAAVTHVVDRVLSRELGLHGADAALANAVSAPHPYPRWLASLGWAGLAAAVALLLGGGPVVWLTAFAVTGFIDRVGRLLSHWNVAPFFVQMVGGFVATISTVGLLAIGVLPPGVEPSLVIATSITVLLSGLSVVNAVQDAIASHPVTAAGRTVEVGLLSAGLLTGVILGLKAGLALQFALNPAEPVEPDISRFGLSVAASAAVAATYALASYAPLRSLGGAALAGGVGWAAYGGLTVAGGFGLVLATGLAAIVIGFASEFFGRTTRTDRHVIVLAGIVPLLPGLTAYRGFYELASGKLVTNGLVTITLALAIGLAIAAGVTFGQFSARWLPVRKD